MSVLPPDPAPHAMHAQGEATTGNERCRFVQMHLRHNVFAFFSAGAAACWWAVSMTGRRLREGPQAPGGVEKARRRQQEADRPRPLSFLFSVVSRFLFSPRSGKSVRRKRSVQPSHRIVLHRNAQSIFPPCREDFATCPIAAPSGLLYKRVSVNAVPIRA